MPKVHIKHKFNTVEILIAIFLALFFDLLSIIPFLNILVDCLAWFIFGLWFFLNGVPPNSGYKVVATATISFVAGFIPVISAFPELTLSIAAIMIIIRLDEKKEYALKLMKKVRGGEMTPMEAMEEVGVPMKRPIQIIARIEPQLRDRIERIYPVQDDSIETSETNPTPTRSLKLQDRSFQNDGRQIIGARQGILFGGATPLNPAVSRPRTFKDPRTTKNGIEPASRLPKDPMSNIARSFIGVAAQNVPSSSSITSNTEPKKLRPQGDKSIGKVISRFGNKIMGGGSTNIPTEPVKDDNELGLAA